MEKTCRLITTRQCNRHCWYCCNNQEHIETAWKDVMLDDVTGKYELYILTGGEPLMMSQFDRTLHVVDSIWEKYYNDEHAICPQIVIYTSICSLRLPEIMPKIHGITYSVHYNWDAHDLSMFKRFQTYAEFYDEHSFRLNIDNTLQTELPLNTSVWTRIQSFEPLNPCPIPEGEDLCRLVEIF